MNKIAVIKIIITIIIIFMLIWLWHSIYIKRQEGKGSKVIIEETFIISTSDKTERNKFYKEGHKKAFYVNGIEAPTIHLSRGVFYAFKNQSDEPLYFTTHEKGGEGAPGSLAKNIKGGFKGLANGTIYFEITDDLPSRFYYHSSNNSLMGSLVVIR